MTFLEGFAQGYGRASERAQDRKFEEQQTQFKYGMDVLLQQRERREKKKAEEAEYAR